MGVFLQNVGSNTPWRCEDPNPPPSPLQNLGAAPECLRCSLKNDSEGACVMLLTPPDLQGGGVFLLTSPMHVHIMSNAATGHTSVLVCVRSNLTLGQNSMGSVAIKWTFAKN